MNREQLKKAVKILVKECLNELLAENYIKETIQRTVNEGKKPKNSVSDIFSEVKMPKQAEKPVQSQKPTLTLEQKQNIAKKLGLDMNDIADYGQQTTPAGQVSENAMKTLGIFDTNFEKFL